MDDGAALSAKFTIRKVAPYLGAEITGIDLRRPLDDESVAGLIQAHAEYGVLVFPDQKIDAEDLKRFGRYWGDLSIHPFSTNAADAPELIVYDNREGNPAHSTDIWHTDETFRECPAKATFLSCKIIPEYGGDTAFANMAAIFEGLSDKMQNFISGLEAVHDFKNFRERFTNSPEDRERVQHYERMYPNPVHPVVTEHPVTRRKVLFVNPQFTIAIKDMDPDESDTILKLLYRKVYQHEYQYRHRWQTDMVVCWDNRLVQHSALHDYYPNRRKMERVTVAGEKPIPAFPRAPVDAIRRDIMPPIWSVSHNRPRYQHEKG
jgi:taurine dioxygenase